MSPGMGQLTALMLTMLSVIPCVCEKDQVDSYSMCNDYANDEVAALQVQLSSSKAMLASHTTLLSTAKKSRAGVFLANKLSSYYPLAVVLISVSTGVVFALLLMAVVALLVRFGSKNTEPFPHSFINGIMKPPFMRQAAFDDFQQNLELRDSDIVIATYPKCGTTWMQQIVLLLQFNGDKEKVKNPMEQAPWIEAVVSGTYCNKEKAQKMSGVVGRPMSVNEIMDWDGSTVDTPPAPHGRLFKTHNFAHEVPWKGGLAGRGKAKIIVVTRNPKDACVSHYHHHKNTPIPMGPGVANIDIFAQRFFAGEVHNGCFWEWHAGWEKAMAGDSGIHWVSYEALKRDPCGEIRKVADFLGLEVSDELVTKVAGKSSFDFMKEQFAQSNEKLIEKGLKVKKDHIRKGEMGSWRGEIGGDLSCQFDNVHKSKCAALPLKYEFDFGVA